MIDNKIFFLQDGATCRIHRNGLIYRKHPVVKLDFKWKDIKYIETHNLKIILHIYDELKINFECKSSNFEEIVKEICLGCASDHVNDDNHAVKFKTNFIYTKTIFIYFIFLFRIIVLIFSELKIEANSGIKI